MIEMYILAVSALGLAPVAWVLLRAAKTDSTAALSLYRNQIIEIDRDAARGLLPADEAGHLKLEAQRRLLRADADSGVTLRDGRNARLLASLAALCAVAAAMVIYLGRGLPNYPDQPLMNRFANAGPMLESRAQLLNLIARLEAQLAADPSSAEGWQVLARAYLLTDDIARARLAWTQLLALEPNRAEAWLELAESETLLADGRMNDAARMALGRARALGLDNSKLRYYAALAKHDGGDLRGALDAWIALARSLGPAAEGYAATFIRIQETALRLGLELAQIAPDLSAPSP